MPTTKGNDATTGCGDIELDLRRHESRTQQTAALIAGFQAFADDFDFRVNLVAEVLKQFRRYEELHDQYRLAVYETPSIYEEALDELLSGISSQYLRIFHELNRKVIPAIDRAGRRPRPVSEAADTYKRLLEVELMDSQTELSDEMSEFALDALREYEADKTTARD